MSHSRRCTSRVLGGALLAALVTAAIVPSAFATSAKVVGSVSSGYPVHGQPVTVSARVLDKHKQPLPGVAVTFVWNQVTKKITTHATTDASGTANSTRTVDARAWQKVSVAESAKVSGATIKGATSFVALPNPSPTSPVTVKIGAGLPLGGPIASLGQGMLRGVELAVAQANASPTVQALGIKFVTSSRSDKADPSVAQKVAKLFAADPAVLGVAGHLTSGCSMAASRVYAGVNIPMVTGASTDPQLTAKGLHDVFRVTYSDTYQGSGAATAAWALGHSRAYVVDDSTAYGNGLANGFATAFSAAGGNVLKHAHTSDTQTKFSSLVTKIVAARPDIVYYGGIFLSGGRLSSQLHVATSTVPVIGGDGLLDPGYIARGGKNGDMCTIAGFPPTALPNGVVFSAAYSAKFPSATMNTYDAYSYDSANVIISALVEQAQTGGTAWLGTRSGKAGTLARISATNMDGATGPISFGPTGERLDPKMSLFKVVSGAWAFQSVY